MSATDSPQQFDTAGADTGPRQFEAAAADIGPQRPGSTPDAAALPGQNGARTAAAPLDMDALRARLAAAPGRQFWRSLEEAAQTPAFQEAARREFPRLGNALIGALLTGEKNRKRAEENTGTQGKEEKRPDAGKTSQEREPRGRQNGSENGPSAASLDRRAFLTVMGASLALAGLSGCGVHQPQEQIVPYIDQPNGLEPGKPLFFATAMPLSGMGQGVLVTSREGRPIKIEGNPSHPSSLGATDALAQASLLSLYDPDRSQAVMHRGVPATWGEFLNEITTRMQAMRVTGGTGLRFLSGNITSPTLAEQMRGLLAQFPNARWCQHEAMGRTQAQAGAQMAFGTDAHALYRLDKADIIVSLDGDFLLTMPGHVRYAADFSQGRAVRKDRVSLNRLYVAESAPTITGAMAEHRLRVRPGEIEAAARALAVGAGVNLALSAGSAPLPLSAPARTWADGALRDLLAHRGRGVVVAGEAQPPIVHALAHALNQALGNAGQTVVYVEPLEADAGAQAQTLPQLVGEMRAGQTQMLVMLDCNPVYTAPADLNFGAALLQLPFSAHLGEYEDETANLSHWHIPQSHYLEAWSDIRAHDGTITVQQPLIAPLYETRAPHELLSALTGQLDRSDHDIVRDHWQAAYLQRQAPGGGTRQEIGSRRAAAPLQMPPQNATEGLPQSGASGAAQESRVSGTPDALPGLQSSPNINQSLTAGAGDNLNTPTRGRNNDPNATQNSVNDFDLYWRSILNDGVVPDTAAPVKAVTLLPAFAALTGKGTNAAASSAVSDTPGGSNPPGGSNLPDGSNAPDGSDTLDIVFTLDPTVWDGRFSPNGWLQELPKPLTKLTWENAACISPRAAQARKLVDGDIVTLRYGGRQIEAPVLIVPGHAPNVVSVSLGYGRTRAGNVGTGLGHNAYALRTADAPWFGTGVTLTKTGRQTALALTHSHHSMEGRDIVRAASITEFRRSPGFVHAHQTEPERPESLYPDYHYPEYAWAMSIDLTRCIGCNACIVACQSENNSAVVGRDEVLKGREMHWLRVDRYYEGDDLDHPDATFFMPVPCMHCEQAPCELVCPPGATLHNRDGLNQMVYNRCIGTRYCSNNCPYKVRRFNFLQYADITPLKQLMRNPEVTVRSRGVMEKCTYCVQRIENAKIQADKENRLVRDGEFTTACAQVCPTNTIVFGNLADPDSMVSREKREPHDYGLLSELNTRPRTTYLGKVSNP